MTTEEEKRRAEKRIIEDLLPHIRKSDDVSKEYQQLTQNELNVANLGRFLFEVQSGKLRHQLFKNHDEINACLRRHIDDFRVLGIDIENHLK